MVKTKRGKFKEGIANYIVKQFDFSLQGDTSIIINNLIDKL